MTGIRGGIEEYRGRQARLLYSVAWLMHKNGVPVSRVCELLGIKSTRANWKKIQEWSDE
jgi:hypothetical protein